MSTSQKASTSKQLLFVYYYNKTNQINQIKSKGMFLQSKQSINSLYETQSQKIKKNIRLIDMDVQNSLEERKHSNKQLNFLVVGPQGSGKRSLIRTINYALNGSTKCYTETGSVNKIAFEKYEIKRNERKKIVGLSFLKQTDEKLGINGYILKQNFQLKKGFLEQQVTIAFLKSIPLCIPRHEKSGSKINLVIICLSLIKKLTNQQINGLKILVKELKFMGIDYLVVGSKVDLVLGNSLEWEHDQEKAIFIDTWRSYISSSLMINNKADIFCIQNYSSQGESNISNQQINYYALSLLELCLKKINESNQPKPFFTNFLCFFCSI